MKGYKYFFKTLHIEHKHLDGSPAAEPRPEGGRYEKVDCWQEASHSLTGLTSQNEDRWEAWGLRRLGERNCSDGAYVRVVWQTVHIWGGTGSRVWEAEGDFCSGVRLLWGKTTELWVNHLLSNWCGRREKRLDLFHWRKLHLLCVLQSSQLIQVLCIHHWEQVTFTHKCKVFNSILFIQ